ncbi:MAG: zeta toxin family protein [Bacteroidales bacterium]|nr:zeta toxin family protein [Bacteroidales bacterium]
MSYNIHRPVLIIIAGPNGSGKTTITSQILHHEWLENSVYINPDQVAQERFGDWNSAEAVRQAAEYCAVWRERCLSNRQSMIFETVFSADDKLDFIRRAKQADFFIRLFFVCTESPMINAARIAGRVMKGGHDVPIVKIIKRYQKSIINCKVATTIADRVYLYDNSVDGHEARILFRFADGTIIKRYTDDIPQWAQSLVL